MSGISTHVLDTGNGKPAGGIAVTLDGASDPNVWERLGSGITDANGRCGDLLGPVPLRAGTYRLTFHTMDYFEAGLHPEVAISFTVRDPEQHYHIPLLISAHSYTTYRGS